MKTSRSSQIAEKIRLDLQNAKWPEGKLPSIRYLASAYFTSPVTIIASLRLLCADKAITSFPGKKGYYRTGSKPPETMSSSFEAPRFLHIGTILKNEILNGTYRAMAWFPLQKECRHRFQCSPVTARAVYAFLCNQGLIEKKGKRYCVRQHAIARPGTSAVYLVGPRDIIDSYSSRFLTCIRNMEREIQALGWGRLRFLFNEQMQPTMVPPNHAVSGYIYIFSQEHRAWLDFLKRKADVPVVFIDNQEFSDNPLAPHKQCYHIVPDNRAAGREVALHLARLGHRRIAVLSMWHSEPDWHSLRLQGIADVFPCEGESQGRSMKLFDKRPRNRPHNKNLEHLIALRKQLQELTASAGLLPLDLREEFTGRLFYFTSSWWVAEQMKCLFDQAIGDTSITAWICINDFAASLAHAYLTSAAIAIPRKISLAGFDNSPTSHKLNITSYDLNIEHMGHLAVQCLIRPELVATGTDGKIRVAGQIIERGSTAAVSGRGW